jgi:anti-anti-sigma factor
LLFGGSFFKISINRRGGIMEITKGKEKNTVILSIKGRMDAVTTKEFDKTMSDMISMGENNFLINLSALEYISSAGLRSILAVAKKLKEKKGEVMFTGLQGSVEDVFKISGLHSLFKIFETEEQALKRI